MVLYKIGCVFFLFVQEKCYKYSLTGSDTNFLLAWDLLTINSVGFKNKDFSLLVMERKLTSN